MEHPPQPDRPRRRVRKVDWLTALSIIDQQPPGTPFLIGVFHRSVATQINKGHYSYIDPNVYEAWSKNRRLNKSELWMARKS